MCRINLGCFRVTRRSGWTRTHSFTGWVRGGSERSRIGIRIIRNMSPCSSKVWFFAFLRLRRVGSDASVAGGVAPSTKVSYSVVWRLTVGYHTKGSAERLFFESSPVCEILRPGVKFVDFADGGWHQRLVCKMCIRAYCAPPCRCCALVQITWECEKERSGSRKSNHGI